jgi:hypothetical protein
LRPRHRVSLQHILHAIDARCWVRHLVCFVWSFFAVSHMQEPTVSLAAREMMQQHHLACHWQNWAAEQIRERRQGTYRDQENQKAVCPRSTELVTIIRPRPATGPDHRSRYLGPARYGADPLILGPSASFLFFYLLSFFQYRCTLELVVAARRKPPTS